MIKHFLFKEKPRIHLLQQQQPEQDRIRYYPPAVWQLPTPATINNQADLDAYWKEHPLNIPTFIKWGSNRPLKDLSDRASVLVIAGKCTDFAKLDFSPRKEPLNILIFNCSPHTQIAASWEYLDNWIPITDEEFKLLIEPIYADVSVKIKHWQEVQKDRLAGPPTTSIQCGNTGGETCDIPTFPEVQLLQGEYKGT